MRAVLEGGEGCIGVNNICIGAVLSFAEYHSHLPSLNALNSYISKVDVLTILVAAAYRHIPSLDQILQPAAVTRLRNQLLEAEYYQLAVEVNPDGEL